MSRTVLPAILLLGALCPGAFPADAGGEAAPIPYRLVVADIDTCEIVKYGTDGKPCWTYPGVKPLDVWPLEDDAVVIAYPPSKLTDNRGGVRIVNAKREVVFDKSFQDEIMSCQPLPGGTILLTENKAGRLTEVTREGKVVRSFDVKAKGMGHKTVRFIRLTPQDTILAAECYSHLLREYKRDGTFLREFKLTMAFCGRRLPDGHTLLSGYRPGRVVEFDKDGTIVWDLAATDLPAACGLSIFGEAHRLPNGNTLISGYGGAGGKRVSSVLEVTPEKKVVWRLKDPARRKVLSVKLLP
jgi:hypothetical protein